MTWKQILGGTAALVLVGGTVSVLTGFGPHGCGRGHGRDPAAMAAFVENRVDDAMDDVDATPAQREKVQSIVKVLLAEGQALRGAHGADPAALLETWKSEAPDAAKLHALVDERAAAMTAFAHRAADAALEVHATLTPEQRAQLARKMERRMGER
jgi:periplasmic protein CpxP/Spy